LLSSHFSTPPWPEQVPVYEELYRDRAYTEEPANIFQFGD